MKLSDLTVKQVANAKVIYDTAIPSGVEAAKAALMTAAAESSFLIYANNGKTTRTDVPQKWRDLAALSMDFPHDAVAGEAWTTADSCGWFQQRAMYGYCTPDKAGIGQLMSAESVRIFVRGSHGGTGQTRYFLQSPKSLTLAQRCQWTQGSEFPTGENYAPMELVADQLIARFQPPAEEDIMASLDDLKNTTEAATAPIHAKLDALSTKVDALSAKVDGQGGKVDALAKAIAGIPSAVWAMSLQSPLGVKRVLKAREWLFEIWQHAQDIKGGIKGVTDRVGAVSGQVTDLASKVNPPATEEPPPRRMSPFAW